VGCDVADGVRALLPGLVLSMRLLRCDVC
jgi:hypothetical protein